MNTVGSLEQVVQLIKQRVDGYILVQRFGCDFEPEMQNFLTSSEKFYSIFVVPEIDTVRLLENVNTYKIRVYCHGVIEADRSNVITCLSDVQLILGDLYRDLKDGGDLGNGIKLVKSTDPSITSENNSRLDFLVGCFLPLEFHVLPVTDCDTPKLEDYE